MKSYHAIVQKGKLNMSSDFMRLNFNKFLRNHEGTRIEFVPIVPEARNQRKFFEGAVVPLVCFFQDTCDHRDPQDIKMMRDRLKIEFNGELVPLKGRGVQKVAKSTKGSLRIICDKVIDWLEEQYAIDRMEVLNPEKYKDWQARIFPYGGPATYIDYLLETNKLKKYI